MPVGLACDKEPAFCAGALLNSCVARLKTMHGDVSSVDFATEQTCIDGLLRMHSKACQCLSVSLVTEPAFRAGALLNSRVAQLETMHADLSGSAYVF